MSNKSGKMLSKKNYRKLTFYKPDSWVFHAGGNAKKRTLKEKGKPLLQRVIERVIKK